jgi:hypothetical protein
MTFAYSTMPDYIHSPSAPGIAEIDSYYRPFLGEKVPRVRLHGAHIKRRSKEGSKEEKF